jgi:arabinogalactan endo-1,4-beta-galactosidase
LLAVNGLATAVAAHTSTVLIAFNNQQTPPDIIEVGNETDNGFLWPIGQIYTNKGINWDDYTTITKTAITAARAASPHAAIMIHYAGVATSGSFYNELLQRCVQFNIAGLSYYPWWHGASFTITESQLNALAISITQDLMIVETSYPFTLGLNDDTNNTIGLPLEVAPSYAANAAGQRNFMPTLHTVLKNLPNQRGRGYCYWAPDWGAHIPSQTSFTQSSS